MTVKWITMLAAFAVLHLLGVAPVRASHPPAPRLSGTAGGPAHGG